MQERRRYRPGSSPSANASWLAEVNAHPLPGEHAPRPGPVTDADDDRLAGFRRRVVEPVVGSVLRPAEIERLSVHRGVDGDEGDVWVRIDTVDGRYEQLVSWPGRPADPTVPDDAPLTEAEVAAQLAGLLEDWVCETGFAWGRQRIARYELPPE